MSAPGERTSEPPPLPPAFRLNVTMDSDWHVGTGAGRPGSVDRLVARDTEGLPYIPAKTLTGILRDASERVAEALDSGERAAWGAWLDYLFGDQPALAERPGARSPAPSEAPRAAHLRIRSAHLPEALRRALRLRPHARDGLTFVKPGVSLDRRSGRARDDHLRFEELARGGVTLTAECAWTAPAEPQAAHAATALLVAAARFVERLGGHRRRGSGRCRLTFEPTPDVESYLAWIESHPPTGAMPHAGVASAVVRPAAAPRASGGWFTVGLRLVAETPLVVPAATVGNVVECLDFVPGTYLLGEVTRRLGTADLAPAVRAAIANGDLIVTHATLEVDGARGRPVPLSLSKRKLGGGLERGQGVFNRLADDPATDGQLKAEESLWVGATRAGTLPVARHVRRRLGTHNTVEDESQRPSSDGGGVYSYQAITAGTVLRAELRLRDGVKGRLDMARSTWWRDLAGTYAVGLAKKDDYGQVSVAVDGEPVESVPQAAGGMRTLAVWLLSDALLDDARLRPARTPEDLAEALGRRLGVTLRLRPEGVQAAWAARDRRSEGWNRSWGLPRPTYAGLSAGTCGVFEIVGERPDDFAHRLADVAAGGIGRRRAEGYGQLAFDDPLVVSPLAGQRRAVQAETPAGERPSGPLVPTGAAEEAYARVVERALWRREIAIAASDLAASPERRRALLGLRIEGGHSHPTLSQLAGLRAAVGALAAPADASGARAWLDGVREVKNRRDKWPQGALDAVHALLTDPEQVWSALDNGGRLERVVLTETGSACLRRELWAEAVRALVFACVRAHKRAAEASARAARPAASVHGG